MPLVAKVAQSAATAKSHCATNWQPAAVAMAWTRAITGTGSLWMDSITRLHWANNCWYQANSGWAAMSLRLCPAQNALPAPASTTTRTLSSWAMASSACCSAASISLPNALKRALSLSVKVTTPRASRRTHSGASSGAVQGFEGKADAVITKPFYKSASTRMCASTLRASGLMT